MNRLPEFPAFLDIPFEMRCAIEDMKRVQSIEREMRPYLEARKWAQEVADAFGFPLKKDFFVQADRECNVSAGQQGAESALVVPLRLMETPQQLPELSRQSAEVDGAHGPWKNARGEWTDGAKTEMQTCREQGMTDRDVGSKFNTSRSTIQRVLGSRIGSKAAATDARHRAW